MSQSSKRDRILLGAGPGLQLAPRMLRLATVMSVRQTLMLLQRGGASRQVAAKGKRGAKAAPKGRRAVSVALASVPEDNPAADAPRNAPKQPASATRVKAEPQSARRRLQSANARHPDEAPSMAAVANEDPMPAEHAGVAAKALQPGCRKGPSPSAVVSRGQPGAGGAASTAANGKLACAIQCPRTASARRANFTCLFESAGMADA